MSQVCLTLSPEMELIINNKIAEEVKKTGKFINRQKFILTVLEAALSSKKGE